jgi:hypothetical protein
MNEKFVLKAQKYHSITIAKFFIHLKCMHKLLHKLNFFLKLKLKILLNNILI